ncbi:MerR family transcriptional regulator [Novosphingobium sp. M1R2S20]|uniref:MerR family transcriptional regulator n=1 Tax=Novosphingobium rhizovicinum TaxID=3228928 RepID=A0ABV3RFV9_9SPHN
MTPEFDDGKAPEALRTIGEVAKALDIRQHVLRYWEEQFPMLRPVKRSGGRRYYRPEDVALIARIDRLVHREGFTLRGARQAIEADNSASYANRSAAPQSPLHTELRAIRDELAAALARC